MSAALFCFILIAEALAQEKIYTNFLQDTLNKIQKQRLDNSGELNETDLADEFKGEIILETNDEGFGSHGYEELHFADNINSLNLDETVTFIPSTHDALTTNAEEMKDDGIKGYYYYYYPLNHYLEDHKVEPSKDSAEMNVMMETMMKNPMMQNQDNKVTPLFKAMTWFIGTAMVFILSILLMPKYKVKKAKEIVKSTNWEGFEATPVQSIVNKYIPESSIVNWKNK